MTIPKPMRSMKTVRNRMRRDVLRTAARMVQELVRRSVLVVLRLVLFDIDGTLIADGGAARQAYAHALQAVYGYRTNLRRYDFSGRTDPQITHMVLGDAGLSTEEIDAAMPRLWEHYLAALERSAPGRVRELPGVRA